MAETLIRWMIIFTEYNTSHQTYSIYNTGQNTTNMGFMLLSLKINSLKSLCQSAGKDE